MIRREKSDYLIKSLARALDVLEEFRGDQHEWGVTELSKKLKLHKNNVFRILATLESRGYIEQNKVTENYRLGPGCLDLGQRFVDQTNLLKLASPVLDQLVEEFQETILLTAPYPQGVILLDAREPELAIRYVAQIGRNVPTDCGAPGKLHLAFADTTLRSGWTDSLLSTDSSFAASHNMLLAQLDEIRQTGVAVDLGEIAADIHAASVPIRDYQRVVVGGLTAIGPSQRLSPERIRNTVTQKLREAGSLLSRRLGYTD